MEKRKAGMFITETQRAQREAVVCFSPERTKNKQTCNSQKKQGETFDLSALSAEKKSNIFTQCSL